MKKLVKSFFRSLGFELSSYSSFTSPSAQLISALKIADINLVFDIGANKGQFCRQIRNSGYCGEVVSFEPLTSARTELIKASLDDEKWFIHEQSAVGDLDSKININIAGNSFSSSVLPMLDSHSSAAVKSAYIGTEEVPICKLDSVLPQYLKSNSNIFIKIDTQGYEWQVLDGSTKALKHASGVLCELSLVPLYEGQHLWREVIDRLELEGFILWAVQKGFTDPRTGQSLQIDGIFLRRELLSPLK